MIPQPRPVHLKVGSMLVQSIEVEGCDRFVLRLTPNPVHARTFASDRERSLLFQTALIYSAGLTHQVVDARSLHPVEAFP